MRTPTLWKCGLKPKQKEMVDRVLEAFKECGHQFVEIDFDTYGDLKVVCVNMSDEESTAYLDKLYKEIKKEAD